MNHSYVIIIMSLCCNCVCWNCCFYNCFEVKPSVKYSFDNSRWMQTLYEQQPNTRLRKIVFPGTHDSGSYSIGSFTCFAGLGRTQNTSIRGQLARGARLFDIRCGGYGEAADSVYIYHGFLMGCHIKEIF